MVWIGVEEFLYKGNVGFLGEMLSKFFKTHVFVLAISFCFNHNLIIVHSNRVIQLLGKLDFQDNKSP